MFPGNFVSIGHFSHRKRDGQCAQIVVDKNQKGHDPGSHQGSLLPFCAFSQQISKTDDGSGMLQQPDHTAESHQNDQYKLVGTR